MDKNKSAAKIEMKKFDDLFETDESREDKSRERLIEVELERIRDFPEHPYLVKDYNFMLKSNTMPHILHFTGIALFFMFRQVRL